jgi:hypothetical protein
MECGHYVEAGRYIPAAKKASAEAEDFLSELIEVDSPG